MIQRLYTVWGRIASCCGLISAVGFGLLAVLVTLDVFVRNLALARWPWLNEITEYLITISTFFGAPWVLHKAGHVNVDILLRLVGATAAQWLMKISYIAGFVICLLLLYQSVRVTLDTYEVGSLVFKNLVFAEWYLMIPVVACFGLCAIEFLFRAAGEGETQ